MNGSRATEPTQAPEPAGNDRLDSWKEIAAYLLRDESTVRRWEKDGLPVHRHHHRSRAAVFAYKSELDAWWQQDGAAARTKLGQAENPRADTAGGPKRLWLRFIPAIAIAVTVMVIVGARLLFDGTHVSSTAAPMTMSPLLSMEGEVSYPAFAPDGKQLAFVWQTPAAPDSSIYVKAIGRDAPIRLTYVKSGGADIAPSWSPDGAQIAFIRVADTQAGIFLVPALGGEERKLLGLRQDHYLDLDWSADGKTIAFAQRASAFDPHCIFLLSVSDGAQRQITFPEKGSFGEVQFAFSPDGKALAFLRHEANGPLISVQVVKLEEPSSARALASYREWISEVTWSADGQSVIVGGYRQGIRKLWRVFLNDKHEEDVSVGTDVYFPAVSRRGSLLAFVREVLDSDLWRAELTSPQGPAKAPAHLIVSKRVEGAPRFSPDGKRIAFQSYRSGVPEIWISEPDGENAVQLTNLRTVKPEMPAWSPDGRVIAFADGGFHVINVNGGPPRRLFAGGAPFTGPSFSRDGQRVYFWRRIVGGDAQIFQVPSKGGVETQVTKNGGVSSMESPDRAFLYFTKLRVPGIWKMPVAGGPEALVLPAMQAAYPGYWAVFNDGIYYLTVDGESHYAIDFFTFATGQSNRIVQLDGLPDQWFGGLTVSPDRRWIVFSQRQYSSSELILAEQFH